MIRLTLQFLPKSYQSNSRVSLDSTQLEDDRIDDSKSVWTVVELSNSMIEFDTGGHIRYSTNISSFNENTLHREYTEALHSIEKILSIDKSDFRVSVIIKNIASVSEMSKYESQIRKFGSELLGNPVDYAELGDDSIKISFSDVVCAGKV
jgi:hypothetical protein